uniref:NAD(P)-binding domain-containing protein n=1 Tax=Zooxanthella nutricula TaxID=1333877 RepID=A0A7S2M7R1_9DINO|mmetsp:Transcript_7384/g.21864  ORF Transcript_7384/g.21864 Transcript_7384/m.21864 type:complete len:138 (+) Transcript_7384:3-416(+)
MSSLGVTRRDAFPFVVLNAARVLDAKARGEAAVRAAAEQAGFDWTIVRPGQLFGGPYDNNFYLGTLFQLDKDVATRGVSVSRGDTVAGDTLRSTLAEVLVQTLQNPATANADFTVLNVEGDAPGADEIQATLTGVLS